MFNAKKFSVTVQNTCLSDAEKPLLHFKWCSAQCYDVTCCSHPQWVGEHLSDVQICCGCAIFYCVWSEQRHALSTFNLVVGSQIFYRSGGSMKVLKKTLLYSILAAHWGLFKQISFHGRAQWVSIFSNICSLVVSLKISNIWERDISGLNIRHFCHLFFIFHFIVDVQPDTMPTQKSI